MVNEEVGKKKKILCPILGNDGKTHWKSMGIGFVNKDLSINVHLEAFPVNGRLQIRDWEDDETFARRPQLRSLPRALPEHAPSKATQDEMPF
jgi:hypothetical protein